MEPTEDDVYLYVKLGDSTDNYILAPSLNGIYRLSSLGELIGSRPLVTGIHSLHKMTKEEARKFIAKVKNSKSKKITDFKKYIVSHDNESQSENDLERKTKKHEQDPLPFE